MLKANPGFDGPVVQVATHDVVIRGLRIRRGPTQKKGSSGDAISISNSKGEPHHADRKDRNGTSVSDIGYTNVEVYINSLPAK
ncbi:MAG: hypothetical protein KAI66_24435 [Lentisphaeria bacterium]|nr:hypothetical protein [Lentisphaeria bacterium]